MCTQAVLMCHTASRNSGTGQGNWNALLCTVHNWWPYFRSYTCSIIAGKKLMHICWPFARDLQLLQYTLRSTDSLIVSLFAIVKEYDKNDLTLECTDYSSNCRLA